MMELFSSKRRPVSTSTGIYVFVERLDQHTVSRVNTISLFLQSNTRTNTSNLKLNNNSKQVVYTPKCLNNTNMNLNKENSTGVGNDDVLRIN
jgi:hypothetical protein